MRFYRDFTFKCVVCQLVVRREERVKSFYALKGHYKLFGHAACVTAELEQRIARLEKVKDSGTG